MSKKLTDQHIDELFLFCKRHYVEYYDLQVEIVDHLAEGIEECWRQDESISFEDALNKQFKKFGIHGFSHLKREKRRALNRKYRRIQWMLILEFYTIPKIFMTLAITMLVFTGLRISANNNLFVISLLVVYMTLFFAYYFLNYKKNIKFGQVLGKRFLIAEVHKSLIGGVAGSAFLPIHLYNMFNGNYQESSIFLANEIYVDMIMSFLITLYGIIMVVMAIYVPRRVRQDFESEFPQFVKS